jgi:hypothetical protein
MADYYPLLAKAVAGLPNSTAEARYAVYDRARKALFGQLRNLDPPVPEEAVEREAQALDLAVARLEAEIATKSEPQSGEPPAAAAASPPAESPVETRRSNGPGPLQWPEPDPPKPADPASSSSSTQPDSAPPTRTPRPSPPLRKEPWPRGTNFGSLPGASPSSPSLSPLRPPSRSRGPNDEGAAKPAPPQGEASGGALPGQGAVGQDAVNQGGFFPPPAATPANERPVNESPASEAPVFESPASEVQGFELASPETLDEGQESSDSLVRMRPEAQRPFVPPPARDVSAAKRLWIVGGIVGLVVVSVAIAAFKLRDRPEDLTHPLVSSSSIPGAPGSNGKIVDRVGGGKATADSHVSGGAASSTANRTDTAKNTSEAVNPAIPVAGRAALLVEAPDEQSKVKTFLGTVVWKVDNVSNGPGEPLGMAVRADIEIPEEKMQAEMTFQKNLDSTLPASHTIKLRFAIPPGSALGSVKQINVMQLRRENTPTGESLKGIPVPIMENAFLVGLARGDAEASNLDLIRTREWLDVPMLLANGRIAKLTFEKGPAGQRALDDALASWQTP